MEFKDRKPYRPSAKEMREAEKIMTDEQKNRSQEREATLRAAFEGKAREAQRDHRDYDAEFFQSELEEKFGLSDEYKNEGIEIFQNEDELNTLGIELYRGADIKSVLEVIEKIPNVLNLNLSHYPWEDEEAENIKQIVEEFFKKFPKGIVERIHSFRRGGQSTVYDDEKSQPLFDLLPDKEKYVMKQGIIGLKNSYPDEELLGVKMIHYLHGQAYRP